MKVVINKCYGGFGLSHKAVLRFAELKGMDIQWRFDNNTARHVLNLPDTFERDGRTIRTDNLNFADWLTKEEYQALTDSLSDPSNRIPLVHYFIGDPANDKDFYDKEVDRADPDLVQVVEELGEDANGGFAELSVVEIPDEVDYQIEEYDGREWIAEVHRTWG